VHAGRRADDEAHRLRQLVNVASVAGKRISYSGDVAYTASKGGVLGFTRHAAFELAASQIRVNAVCPGPTLTPMILRNLSQERMDAVVEAVPLGRWVQPADVANVIEFLAGDGAAMCTGTSIEVDGGVMVSNGSRYQDYFAARS
jgi:3-oxoacyl-[acyl-carrier protein] reductase